MSSVLRYAIQTEQVNRILRLLTVILDVRMAFYDTQGSKVEEFDTKSDSGYCRWLRRDPAFDHRCLECDSKHIEEAMVRKRSLVYTCHNNLIEGVVPLFDGDGQYMGAIVFGQIRSRGTAMIDESNQELRSLFDALPLHEENDVHDIAELLNYFASYMMQNHLIRYQKPPWSEILQAYIEHHLAEDLTMKRLAGVCGYSVSFLSHHFKEAFGCAPHQYVFRKRMEKAKELLVEGRSVKETAIDLGFYDMFHFSKTFKKRFGAPPSAFRASAMRSRSATGAIGRPRGGAPALDTSQSLRRVCFGRTGTGDRGSNRRA